MLRQQSGRAKRHTHSCVFLLRPPLPKVRRRGGRQFFHAVDVKILEKRVSLLYRLDDSQIHKYHYTPQKFKMHACLAPKLENGNAVMQNDLFWTAYHAHSAIPGYYRRYRIRRGRRRRRARRG